MVVKISHITHFDNLDSILSQGCLWSDAKRIELGLINQNIGYSHIKQRRLIRPVSVAAGGTIGQYVPFNFCPRSVMLYVIHRGHDDYRDGQDSILHLISDVDTVRLSNQYCFFTDIHADLDYAEQIDDFSRINELDIKRIINERYWHDFKEEKQAEFLAFESVQWHTIHCIGVKNQEMSDRVRLALEGQAHQPEIVVKPSWYY
ncbi:MAG: type II toxin-antitoxin system toxin DNA ADP-ribosyl transferase DarT [Plesiomonas sp.]